MSLDREFLGTIATCFIILAFICKDIKKIRSFDMIGALLFIAYGLWIKSFSTILLNAILVGINVFHLIKLKKEEK